MSNFIYYEKLEDYEEQVKKAKECDEKDKEIERLKEREKMLQESFSDWKKGIEKERKYWLCERTDCCGRIKDSKKYNSLCQENKRLNNRIEKAIEYIKEQMVDVEMNIYGIPPTIKSFRGNTERLLEILKGEDKE